MLTIISTLSALLPILFFVFFCIRNSTRELWVIFIYSIASFLFDGFLTSSSWAIDHKFLLWNVFAILEFCILSYFFYIIIKNRPIRILIQILAVLYLIAFSLFATSSNNHFNSILSAISSVIILTFCIVFFVLSMKITAEPTTLFSPTFLIVIALLLYVASTLFLYIIAGHLAEKEREKYWSINNVSNIISNLIFSIAFFLNRYQKKNPFPENAAVDFTSFPDDR